LFIIAETEIWPNLITCLHKMDIPVVTVNGRISDRSYAGYRMIKLLVRPVLKKNQLFLRAVRYGCHAFEQSWGGQG